MFEAKKQIVKKFSRRSFKRCFTSFQVTPKQILVPACQAAVVLWTFANITLVHSGSRLPRSSVPLGLQSLHPCLPIPTLQEAAVLWGNSLLLLQCILVATYHATVILWALGIFITVSSDTDLPSSSGPVDIRCCPRSTLGIPPTEKPQG